MSCHICSIIRQIGPGVGDFHMSYSSTGNKVYMASEANFAGKSSGLKYNFQGGELFSSTGPSPFLPGDPQFIFWAHVSTAGSQIINDRLNVISTNSWFFFNFVKFCKSIPHCEAMIVKMWNLSDSLTIGLL